MIRTESYIKTSKELFRLCNKSKLLYNKAMYLCRQHYFKNKNKEDVLKCFLFYKDLYELLKSSKEYKDMHAQSAQQTLKLVDKSWKTYRKSIVSYYKDKSKFKTIPKIPKYKKGDYQVLAFPCQNVSFKSGIIKIPKTKYTFKTRISCKKQLKEFRLVPYCGKVKIEVVYEKPEPTKVELDNSKYIGIDIGVNNLATISSNQGDIPTFLINGRCLKSFNQFYNKIKSKEVSNLRQINNKYWSKKLDKLSYKRNQKVNDYLHKASRWVVNLCIELKIKNIVIGNNKGWKQNIKIGKRNNQNFVNIPFDRFINMIQYKANEYGINVILTEESYTSKTDHLVYEKMCKHKAYKGKRTKRGLFQSSLDKTINADINGSIGILRKVVGDSFIKEITNRGLVYRPFKVSFV